MPTEEYTQKGQLAWKIGFAAIFLGSLLTTIFQIDRVTIITPDECLRDYTFIWTDSVNRYLSLHRDLCDRYIIYCSFLMDFMLILFFASWFLKWKTFRPIITYVLFFGARGVIQVRKES